MNITSSNNLIGQQASAKYCIVLVKRNFKMAGTPAGSDFEVPRDVKIPVFADCCGPKSTCACTDPEMNRSIWMQLYILYI